MANVGDASTASVGSGGEHATTRREFSLAI